MTPIEKLNNELVLLEKKAALLDEAHCVLDQLLFADFLNREDSEYVKKLVAPIVKKLDALES